MEKNYCISAFSLLFSISLFLAILISFIVRYFTFISNNEYIWFCSKILSIKKIIEKNNNNETLVFYGYSEGNKGYIVKPENYLEYLTLISNNSCIENHQQCGILDTYGNPFCFPDYLPCPVNEIKKDICSLPIANEYLKNGYEHEFTVNSGSGKCLYFKRGLINNEIIAYWHNKNYRPKYINLDNFILDLNAMKEVTNIGDIDFKVDSESNINEIIIKDKNVLKSIIDYIIDKIEKDEENIDFNYRKIDDNLYVKSFIGFKDIENIKKFNIIDFSAYKFLFPNKVALVFSILCSIFFILSLLSIIYKIIIACRDNIEDFGGVSVDVLILLVFYWIIFIGFFIYSLVQYFKIKNRNEAFELARSINADKFIENFLKDFAKVFENKNFIFNSIIMLSMSALLYILAILTFYFFETLKKCIKNCFHNCFKSLKNCIQNCIDNCILKCIDHIKSCCNKNKKSNNKTIMNTIKTDDVKTDYGDQIETKRKFNDEIHVEINNEKNVGIKNEKIKDIKKNEEIKNCEKEKKEEKLKGEYNGEIKNEEIKKEEIKNEENKNEEKKSEEKKNEEIKNEEIKN